MTSAQRDLEDLLARLEHDVAGTVGGAHAGLVRELAGFALALDLDEAERLVKVVDDVQQALHDTFVDTRWPACPRHGAHPMRYRDGAWWCEQDGTRIAGLGELANPPARG